MIRHARRGSRLREVVASIALGLLAPCSPALAQDRVEGLSAGQLFDLAHARRAAGSVEDAIVIYDALARDPDPDVRAEARYRKGLTLADLRRFAEAAVAFRALLDEKPDAIAARLELARMLAAMGREAEARRELRQARATGIPPDAAFAVDQFARALRSPKRVGGSVELALAPDSNINRATQARTLDTIIAPLTLSEDARETSGIGVRVAGQAFAKIAIADQLSLLPRVSGLGNFYRKGQFDDASASALLGFQWQGRNNRISPSVGMTYRWYGGQLYASTQTFSIDWLRPIGTRSQLVASGSASNARYERNPLQNGKIYDMSLSFERALSSVSGASMTAAVTRQSARDPGYATWAGGFRLSGWQEIGLGTLFVSSGIGRTEGDERLFLFPERRRDWLLTARAGIALRSFAVLGFAPTVRLNIERNVSTVGIYDYRRVGAEFGVTRAF